MIVESPLLALDHVHRRNFLGLGLSAVPGLIGSEAIAAAGFDTSDSFANLRAYVKMLSTFAEQPVFTAYIGQCFARIGDTLTPLFGYGGYVLSQARLAANKQIEMRGKEVALYIDHKTGEVLETWDNPFTHERVPVFHMLNPGFYSKLGAQWPAANFVGAADNKLTALWEIDLSTIQSSAGMSAGATLTKPFLLPWTKAGKSYATSMMMSVKKENPVSPAKWPKASTDRKSTRLNSSHGGISRMPSSA